MPTFDVVIVGAGLSGIGAAHHLRTSFPDKQVLILERRASMGGTWDLFRYPGVRSDSDMYTLGYAFRPWIAREAIADGPAICDYIQSTAREGGIAPLIRYGQHVQEVCWSSRDRRWKLSVRQADGSTDIHSCRFLYMCTGYYSYDEGHDPVFEGRERFRGQIVHPQFWPEKLDYSGKRVVVIGSGATAITLVPSMAEKAAHVTMVQRSPTYIARVPKIDAIAQAALALLPKRAAYHLVRFKNLLMNTFYQRWARRRPEQFKALLIRLAAKQLPLSFDVKKHMTPRYNPWDQRLCAAPDGDFFRVIREGTASIETDEIRCFTEAGVMLRSGRQIPADIIVTATGLKMELMSGIKVFVDDKLVVWSDRLTYRGFMYSDVPNLVSSFGYTMASWTLKSDLIAGYVCRLLKFMDRKAYSVVTPRSRGVVAAAPALTHLNSGYVERARAHMPRQSDHAPWMSSEDYFVDARALPRARFDDGALEFFEDINS